MFYCNHSLCRLQPRASDDLPAAPRLYPKPLHSAPYPEWVRKISSIDDCFVSVQRSSSRTPIVLCTARTHPCHPWGLLLRQPPHDVDGHAVLPIAVDWAVACLPLQDVVREDVHDDASVHRLVMDMSVNEDHQLFVFRCREAYPVTLHRRAARRQQGDSCLPCLHDHPPKRGNVLFLLLSVFARRARRRSRRWQRHRRRCRGANHAVAGERSVVIRCRERVFGQHGRGAGLLRHSSRPLSGSRCIT